MWSTGLEGSPTCRPAVSSVPRSWSDPRGRNRGRRSGLEEAVSGTAPSTSTSTSTSTSRSARWQAGTTTSSDPGRRLRPCVATSQPTWSASSTRPRVQLVVSEHVLADVVRVLTGETPDGHGWVVERAEDCVAVLAEIVDAPPGAVIDLLSPSPTARTMRTTASSSALVRADRCSSSATSTCFRCRPAWNPVTSRSPGPAPRMRSHPHSSASP